MPELPTRPLRRPSVSARTQLGVAAAAGLVVGVGSAFFIPAAFASLLGWDTAAGVYVVWVWLYVWPMNSERTAAHAVVSDPTRGGSDIALLCASVASLVAVGFVLGGATKSSGASELAHVGLALASVALSWTVVHTVFTLRYARLYYTGHDGGVSFNQKEPPTFGDFAYLAFTIGMTFQVSDTDLQESDIRRTALRHALLSYLLGTGVLATTVNLVASLSSK